MYLILPLKKIEEMIDDECVASAPFITCLSERKKMTDLNREVDASQIKYAFKRARLGKKIVVNEFAECVEEQKWMGIFGLCALDNAIRIMNKITDC